MAVMTLKALLPIALLVTVAPAPASAQLSRRTFGGLPFWADSALGASGLGQRFILSSELNTIYEFGDFDRDGLLDVAVEIKDTGGLRYGIATVRASPANHRPAVCSRALNDAARRHASRNVAATVTSAASGFNNKV